MNLIKKFTATAALFALVSGLFATNVSAADNLAIEAANRLAEVGIIVDNSSNPVNYELNRNVLRQEIAAVARGLAKVDKTTTCENLFDDVSATKPNTWACYTVEALRKADLIAANKMFRPEDNITKAEAIGMVVKAAYGSEYMYDSSKDASWQEQVVDFASKKGIVEKFTDYNALATRGFVFKAGSNGLKDENVDIEKQICQILGTCTDEDKDDTNTNTDKDDKDTNTDKDNNVVLNKDVLVAELSPETPANGNVAAGAARTKMLGFDVTAGNTDVTLKTVALKFSGLGDSDDVNELAVYDGNRKVTRGAKNFSSDDTASLSFERDIVIKAGETKTFFVTATIEKEASNYNQTLQITLTDLEASSAVEGDNIVGATLQPIKVANVGELELRRSLISSKIMIGDEVTLADFSLNEKSDKEGVKVGAITFDIDGSIDADDIADLALYADGKKIDVDFTIKNSEIYADITDFNVPQDKKVNFLLKGSIVGSVNDTLTLTFESDAVYAVGASSDVSIDVKVDSNNRLLSDTRKIEGSEINVAFNRSNIDEAKPDSSDVKVGEISLSSVSDYTIKKLEVTVENKNKTNTKPIKDIIDELEVNNTTEDSMSPEKGDAKKVVYTFEDIDIKKGETKKLPITLDIVDEKELNGINLSIDFKITEIKDYDNNKTYTTNGSNGLNVTDILSSNSFNPKTLEVKSASVEITGVNVNDTKVVLGNGIKTVLYKGRLSVGDADSVVIRDFDLEQVGTINSKEGTINLSDVVSDATLNIGGKTFKGDISGKNIEFNSISATIAAGADNVDMLVVGTLKDNNNVSNGAVLKVEVKKSDINFDDSEGNSLSVGDGSSYDVDLTGANNSLTQTTLNEKGAFFVDVTKTGDHTDDIKDVVLAGTNSVNLAEIRLQADQEDANVKRLTFEISGTGATDTASSFIVNKYTDTANKAATPATTAKAQITKLGTVPALDDAGTLSISVNGNVVSDSTFAGLATKIQNQSKVSTAVYDNSTSITVKAETAGTPFTLNDYKFNGSADSKLTITTTQINVEASAAKPAVAEVVSYTFDRTLVSGDSISVGSSTATDSIEDVVAKLNSEISGGTAVKTSDNKITVTANTAGTFMGGLPDSLKVTGSTGGTTNAVDFSDTFNNIRLMDGSKTIADGAVTSYDSSSKKTYVTFKNFTLESSDSRKNVLLVADLSKYTTSGSETSAQLGDFTVGVYDAKTTANTDLYDVEGVNSQDDMTMESGIFGGASQKVSIIPVKLTVSVKSKLGTNDRTAEIKFTIDKGNNVLDNDDIKVKSISLANSASEVEVRDDSGSVILASNPTATNNLDVDDTDISNGDAWEFAKTLDKTGEIRIAKYGINYTVNNKSYRSSNEDILDLGTYSK